MKTIVHSATASLPQKAKQAARNRKHTAVTQALGFFDLYGSTQLKLQEGHTKGTEQVLKFVSAARSVVTLFHGHVIKEMGDGILCTFADPLDSCKAALNLKSVCHDLALLPKCGLTIGRVARFTTSWGGGGQRPAIHFVVRMINSVTAQCEGNFDRPQSKILSNGLKLQLRVVETTSVQKTHLEQLTRGFTARKRTTSEHAIFDHETAEITLVKFRIIEFAVLNHCIEEIASHEPTP